jgi:acyl-CoA thioesterase
MDGAAGGTASAFEQRTSVVPSGEREGSFRAHVDEGWSGYRGAHGGYTAAIVLRAMAALARPEHTRPRTLTVQLTTAIMPGEVPLEGALERAGRSLSWTSCRLVQDGATGAAALASFSAPGAGPEYRGLAMPAVPPPEEVAPADWMVVPQAGITAQIEYRPLMPDTSATDRTAELAIWMRLRDPHPLDPYLAAFLIDAPPPALYVVLDEYPPMPSTEMALQFPEPQPSADDGWLLGVGRTLTAGGGYAVEDGELWTTRGELVASSRQLRRILTA